ncbi:MAG: GH92 family glycosyl hydrolase [Bacteroidales bacterium]|nr:GH92 family glycosyl hydrolase [Bacteroidales bacterium]
MHRKHLLKTPHIAALALIAALFSVQVQAASNSSDEDYTRYVNPFVGTDGHGHTFPAALYPFGMVQAGPDTRLKGWDGCSGYHYSDSVILGFTHTHLSGVGCLDYGDILLMPVIDGQVASHFSHDRESAEPGYYRVFLDHQRVDVSIAAGRRMALHQYDYPSDAPERAVVVDLHHRDRLLGCSLETVGDRAVQGWRQSRSWAKKQDVYFYAEFSSPIVAADFRDSAFVRLSFGPEAGSVKVKIGISGVSCDNAKANLLSEKAEDDWDMGSLRASTSRAWNDWLSRIRIEASPRDMRTFYSALYHCAIHPSLYSDVNGEYKGMDRKVHRAEGFERYTVFSVWDVFRSEFPLFNMIGRDIMPDFLESMLSVYREGGRLPKWELAGFETEVMIGFNAVSVIADAYVKGLIPEARLRGYYEAMKATAEGSDESHTLFCKYGFDPAGEDNESVSKTLEFAYDDWCVAVIAKALGEQADYGKYIERSQYWKNLFDPQTGFMRPRELKRWAPDFNPSKVSSHFTEANSWQYSFFVPHDIAGHIEAFGGVSAYTAKLDALFNASLDGVETQLADVSGFVGQYAHGNEPSHHVAYLYDFVGQPWKTQELVRHICRTFYGDGPDGLCGNEDCGQMSAWYVLSAIGLFPLTPGTTTLALSTPLFRRADIDMGGNRFTVTASVPERTYIASARLSGRKIDAAAIDFGEIIKGGSLNFTTSSTPTAFGSKPVMVTSIDPACRYDAVFPEGFGTPEPEPEPVMKAYPQTEYHDSYTAGGGRGLVDGKRGKRNWRAGGWQGYEYNDIDVVVDLLGEKTISSVTAGFLQDMENYIWMPRDMQVFVSDNGVDFRQVGERVSDVAIDNPDIIIEDWTVEFEPVKASYVRVTAHHFGEIPFWHRGYGEKCFTFIDEIMVK